MFVFGLLVGALGVVGLVAGEDVLVETSKGTLRGIEMTSRGGRKYSAFSRVPYAKPPIADRRFKAPEPMDPWEGVRDATKELEFCLQVPVYDPFLRNTSRGTDDCLYLNVYSPNMTGSLPVMIYTHGGGWRSGSPGNGPKTRSKYLMDEDVVLVTPNYRVGVLGFLSTEDDVISGNFGLKDQTAALKWIQEEIKHFGGDPKQVTVFGESVGGASANLLLLSPLSRDMVVRGISQSGTATGLWIVAPPGLARHRSHQVADMVGCPSQPHSEMLTCLLTKSSKELAETDILFNKDDFNPSILHSPVMESKDVKDPFLTEMPYKMVNKDKTWIAGINTGEGGFKMISYKVEPELIDSFKIHKRILIPECIMYTNTSTQVENITDAIIKRYNLDSDDNDKIESGVNDMFADLFFLLPLEVASQITEAPMYRYVFDHRGKTSSTDILARSGGRVIDDLGVSHTDENLYLFNFEDEVPDMMTPEDTEVSKRMVKLWTNFAKHGVPTLPDDDVQWNKYDKNGDKSYLRIRTKDSKMETGWKEDTVKFMLSLPLRDKLEKLNL